ncbi:MAG: PHP domain-containing protein [Lachnospiraceae bacterium]|nr:PHP domain-containing protein [Lachnospiraceae bacterium]
MKNPGKIDLHMHTNVSDGTDTPEEIFARVKAAGFGLFSITDHDAVKAAGIIPGLREEGDPLFLSGAEFSCKDEEGKYHILGYGFDPEAGAVKDLVDLGHSYRMNKVRARLKFLTDEFGFTFPQEELDKLFAMDNPGKPHIANLMVKLGYVKTKEIGIRNYINKLLIRTQYVRPEEAISGILGGGGIPVLAHPAYGSGDQLILGEEMEERLKRLMDFGLQGVEAYYSGFPKRIREEMLGFAKRFGLYVTAGSDYHGRNKLVVLGDNGLDDAADGPDGLQRFLEAVSDRV